jgi:hypothetical protein
LVAALAIATLIDWALAALLVGVSGFILEGVNNTGPQMPVAALLVAFVVFSLAAPLVAWMMRHRALPPGLVLALAAAPIAIASATLLLEPVLVR